MAFQLLDSMHAFTLACAWPRLKNDVPEKGNDAEDIRNDPVDRKLKARKLSESLVAKLEVLSNKLESSNVVTSC